MDSPRFDPLDTTSCEEEPIRYPGAVQPHGALLVLDPVSGVIEAASESCLALMGRPAGELLEQSLASVLGPAARDALMGADNDSLQALFPLTLNGQPFTARSLRNASGQYLVDIEPSHSRTGSPEQLGYNIRSGLETLRRLGGSAEICQAAAQLIGKLTGFDQVMIYRFDAHWNGEIIAEAVAPGIEPYLGLHFPASDIPQQARELFKECRVRLIADVHYAPSALLTRRDACAIDLGRSSLRSVSPLHIQYLKNMGARATLVCALVVQDRLWGLVSCQQKKEPRYFCQAERDALGWLCQDAAALIEARVERERNDREHCLATRRRKLINAVRSREFSKLIREHKNADLLGVVGSDGFALLVDEAIQTAGATPSLERIRELNQRRLELHPSETLFASHSLVQDLGPGPGDAEVAGALFVTVLRQPVVTMIWFRRERRHQLAWGGDPTQPHLADASGHLTPRTSFQQYLQEVNGQSREWLPEELESAGELVALVEIEALRNSEAFSRTILNSMTEHISVLDEHGVILSVNDAWKRFAADNNAPEWVQSSVGVSYRDVCVTAAAQPSGAEARAAWAGIEAVLKRQLATFSLDYPCDSPVQKRWFRMNVYPVQAPSYGAIVAHENITPRKQAELARERSEAHLKAAQQIASLGSWEWDVDTGENRWSDQQYRIFGYAPGSIRPGYDLLIESVHPDDRSKLKGAIDQTLANAVPYSVDCRIVRLDGSIRHIQCQGELEGALDSRPRRMAGTVLDITERREAADRLRESEKRFREMADSAPVLIWISGVDKLCFWFNKVWLEFTGRTMDQEMGNGWAEGVHPQDLERCLATYLSAFESRREFVMEYRLRRSDGEYRWLVDNGVPRIGEAGVFSGYIGSCIDITDRKQVEFALQTSQQRLTLAQEGAHIGIWEWDITSGGMYWSPECERLYGVEPGTLKTNQDWRSRVHPDDRAVIDRQWSQQIEQHLPFEVEYRLLTDAGETRWLLSKGQAQYDAMGKPICLSGINIDITERKAAETERKRLAKIIEDAPDFIAMSDMQSNLKYLNAAGARMVGLAAEVDLSPLQIKDMHPQWAARRVLDEGVPAALQTGSWQGETALLHRDGHETPVSQVLLLHRDEAGKPQYLSTIMRDISLLKTREKELDIARLAAEQANVAKSRFLATMSHEIRTPMNGILGMAQLLLATGLSERLRRDYARTILASGQTLLMLLNDILDLSKIESGRLQLEQTVFDPASLLQETRSLFSGAAQTKGLQLGCQWLGTGQYRYAADPYRIRQMLTNLVGNALKFTAQGSVTLEGTELEQTADSAVLEFSVADTGIGIPTEKIDLLFKPFSQTDNSTTREYGGTGLGLSIVSNLARAMGGTVGVESAPGNGSRFWFRLLAKRVEPGDESRSAERLDPNRALAPDAQIKPDGRALVAEDNAINCMVIESLLATIGVKVTLVNDGQQAVNAIRNGDRPDIILMDLHMPVMDGYTATQLIRQWERDQDAVRLPIIALTADAFAEDRQHCMEVGMDDFLTKPIVIEALKAALATWMPARTPLLPEAFTAPLKQEPLDLPRFQKLAAELRPLLTGNFFDAFERFRDLQALAAGTVIAAEIDEMVPVMESLRFALVLQRLNDLAEQLGRSESGRLAGLKDDDINR